MVIQITSLPGAVPFYRGKHPETVQRTKQPCQPSRSASATAENQDDVLRIPLADREVMGKTCDTLGYSLCKEWPAAIREPLPFAHGPKLCRPIEQVLIHEPVLTGLCSTMFTHRRTDVKHRLPNPAHRRTCASSTMPAPQRKIRTLTRHYTCT